MGGGEGGGVLELNDGMAGLSCNVLEHPREELCKIVDKCMHIIICYAIYITDKSDISFAANISRTRTSHVASANQHRGYTMTCTPSWGPLIPLLLSTIGTDIVGLLVNLYRWRILMRVILVSIMANLVPMQIRCPAPNGRKAEVSLDAFSSGVNLQYHRKL